MSGADRSWLTVPRTITGCILFDVAIKGLIIIIAIAPKRIKIEMRAVFCHYSSKARRCLLCATVDSSPTPHCVIRLHYTAFALFIYPMHRSQFRRPDEELRATARRHVCVFYDCQRDIVRYCAAESRPSDQRLTRIERPRIKRRRIARPTPSFGV